MSFPLFLLGFSLGPLGAIGILIVLQILHVRYYRGEHFGTLWPNERADSFREAFQIVTGFGNKKSSKDNLNKS